MHRKDSVNNNLSKDHDSVITSQIEGLYVDLSLHSALVQRMVRNENTISHPMYIGHLEGHQDSLSDLLFEAKTAFSHRLKFNFNDASRVVNQRKFLRLKSEKQAMVWILTNLKSLRAKMRRLKKAQGANMDTQTAQWFAELQRRLQNDLHRTAYLLK